jgi:predicted dehydrogenase
LVLKIGIIGYKNHAARLIDILENRTDCNIDFIYHPKKSFNDKRHTNDLDDLYNCDAVFISSPNITHFDYIETLQQNFNGYIFCEKPPTTNLNELEKLEKLPEILKNKLFFNFNFRFSEINQTFKNYFISETIGKIIHISIISSHGLAFKKEYLESWRANGENNLNNILNTVSIHFLDLLNLHFGIPKYSSYNPSLISKNGTAFDTDFLLLKYNNGISASILNSYASPLINEISILGTNGYLTIRDQKLILYSPRDNFDSDGFFIEPEKIIEKDFNLKNDYNNSLVNSIDYFISNVKNKNPIDPDQYISSMSTTRLLISLNKKEKLS